MNIAFERSLRNALFPVIHRKNRNMSDCFESKNFKYLSVSDDVTNFSVDHLLIINIIHDAIAKMYFGQINNGYIPRTIQDPLIYDAGTVFSKNFIEEHFDCFYTNDQSIKPKEISFTDKYSVLLDVYPFLLDLKITSKRMVRILQQIDNLRFNLVLKLRFLKTKTYSFKNDEEHTKAFDTPKVFSTLGKRPAKLFSFEVKDEVHDGRGLIDAGLHIDLTTFFGHVAIQGIQLLNIDYVPEEIYTTKMSEYAKLFYIFCLVGKNEKISLKRKQIIDRLLLTDERQDQQDKTIRLILDRLGEKNLIKHYELLGKIKNRRYEITK